MKVRCECKCFKFMNVIVYILNRIQTAYITIRWRLSLIDRLIVSSTQNYLKKKLYCYLYIYKRGDIPIFEILLSMCMGVWYIVKYIYERITIRTFGILSSWYSRQYLWDWIFSKMSWVEKHTHITYLYTMNNYIRAIYVDGISKHFSATA